MIDSHCHLYEIPEKEWRDNGLEAMICAGADMESSKKSVELAERYPEVYATVGIHPEGMAHEMFKVQDSMFNKLLVLTKRPKVVAVGECGLDSGSEEEVELFKFNINLAKETGLPLVVHCRNMFEKVFQVLSAKGEVLRGIQMHCWTGNMEWTKRFLDLGCYLSFGGIVTFKNSGYLREVAKIVPEDRLLAETDSPYLSPEPVRGAKNTPANVKYVLDCLAEIRGTNLERITSENAKWLFNL